MTNPELATRICEKLADSIREMPEIGLKWNQFESKTRVNYIIKWEKMVEKELNQHRDS